VADPAPRAVIFGVAGLALSEAERLFFAEADPLGFILFARNCHDRPQLQALVNELRGAVGRADAPVLIDQEGGRVQRLKPPHWRAAPPSAAFGALCPRDERRALAAAWLNARLLAADLSELGITMNCAPVLDVRQPGGHEIIGDRAFAHDPQTVALLGRATCGGLLTGGVLPIIKHIPGHGRATRDSHVALPVVEAAGNDLGGSDFAPFAALADMPMAMTAHVVYAAFDPDAPATTSATVLREVVRGAIGFDGLLLSDDLCMRALCGGFDERAAAAIAAGCDVVLHCSGDPEEMRQVAGATPRVTAAARHRLARAQAMLKPAEFFDRSTAEERLAQLMAVATTA
jgi:beta-N-acetylhexosaminidase